MAYPMKYWNTGQNIINLIGPLADDGSTDDRIVAIELVGEEVLFTEQCDCYFSRTMTKAEAIEALLEAIKWLESR
jgi:hypothetical protein